MPLVSYPRKRQQQQQQQQKISAPSEAIINVRQVGNMDSLNTSRPRPIEVTLKKEFALRVAMRCGYNLENTGSEYQIKISVKNNSREETIGC